MAFKFYRIVAANAEIDRLAAELATATKERDEYKASLESNTSETAKAAEELQAKVDASTKSIADLEAASAAKDAQIVSLTDELTKAKNQLANPSGQIAKLASQQAATITAAQGQPALPAATATSPGANGGPTSADELMAQAQAITDPNARTMFFRKNRAAFMAAKRSRCQ